VVAQACKPPAYRTLLYYAVAGFPVLLVIKIAGSESAGVADCESLEVMAVGDYALLTTHYSLLTTHYSLLISTRGSGVDCEMLGLGLGLNL
jgi:hypothetical protein